ncbi:putative cobalt transporter subunit (CbtA) [Nonomuraea coxensis DSM 45129]|uniref:Cobalt transporter subunit (CbtA) n=1 Tax=Nonomuraea coxensis DSM 45129 TaxID=1122611 RepID=A0ABX8U3N2_9ACTN|nr:CbtA family protein [Nonomuraea coxensis]QYC42188.1 putative cobalt transporter subunit (CbtA) [Nonomuraea coxensis DSM 45129]
MMRVLLIRGMLVGLASAVFAYVCAWFLGEGPLGDAIAFEDQRSHAAGGIHEHAAEVVSRLAQQTAGLAVALAAVGVAVGGLFAIAFALAHHRIGRMTVRTTSMMVASAGFVVISLVPFLKYPPNPPAVGDPDTIQQRSLLYFLTIVIGIFAAVTAVQTGRRLTPRHGGWNASLLGGGVFVALVGIAYVVLPGGTVTEPGFPPDVLWDFRIASLATQAVIWLTLGLGFGALTERDVAGARRERAPEIHAKPSDA